MKEIKLTQGKITLVDDEDFEELNKYKWCFNTNYAIRHITIIQGNKALGIKRKQKRIWLHRVIMNTPDGYDTDHIDRNTLNNQKYNLRIATTSQNQMNTQKRQGLTSNYKGVYFDRKRNKYRAQIRLKINGGKQKRLGYFNTAEEAATIYDQYAKKYFGEFAVLNFPNN